DDPRARRADPGGGSAAAHARPMKRVACWFLAAVVSAAAAGAAAGMVLCRRMPPPGGGLQPGDRRVVEDYAADFRLSAEQTELLRAILRTLRDEEAAIY